MSPTFGLVKDITPRDTHWALRLRLLCVYDNISDTGDIRGLECVFHDNEGARIHATIRIAQMAKYRQILKERCLYVVRHFIVANDGKKCKTTDNKFKMIFYEKTEVINYDDDAFPNHVYKFKRFESLLNVRIINETELFVVSKQAVREVIHNGRRHRLIEVALQDTRLNQLSCTFWDDFVDQILPYIGDDQTEPVIVTLQFCDAGIFREPKISSNYNVTRVVINGDDVEFEKFKNSLQEVNILTQLIRTISVTTDKQMSISEDLDGLKQPLKTIEELYETRDAYSSQGEVTTPDDGKANNEEHKNASTGERLKRDLIRDSSCISSLNNMRKIVKLKK
ncbi:unnamed protein product [Cuscuta europaea]|uniref:Replication protein A 70 kDa DNA-binding subunit B/D first OB fold domain-containing protein n=1 Tax=Cuscuta europaea TaxID=41803 RepID=A0A9P1E4F8_CUSEU|nr:unnamed protein product [Cuscuta europaea]